MSRYHRAHTEHKTVWWRVLLSGLLITLAALALVLSVSARYVRDNVLDTKRYVEVVGTLTSDPAVTAALGVFTAEKIFDSAKVDQQLTSFLPDRLAPAVPLLSDSLQEQVAEVTEKIVASESFGRTWENMNRRMHENLMEVAHSEPNALEDKRAEAVLKLDPLLNAVRDRFNGGETILNDEQKDSLADVRVDIQQSANQLRTTVSVIETGAWLLPLLTLLLFGLAIWVAKNRRHTVMAIGIVMTALASTILLTFRLVSQHYFNAIEQPVYRDAAVAIYETVYGNLRGRLYGVVVVGLVVVFLALLFGPSSWATKTRRFFSRNSNNLSKKYFN